jgi:hypothetical protein
LGLHLKFRITDGRHRLFTPGCRGQHPDSPKHQYGTGTFVGIITPFREDIVVAVEYMFTWYWIADLSVGLFID